jgi:hydrocephalus-inducing protein
VCSVDGGPDYEVPILGESSIINYKLSQDNIDFGEVPFNEMTQREFFIENTGKVPFEFNINLGTVSRPGLIECMPMTGKIISQERFKVIVKFFPGIPDNISEIFLVECAHFPQERFKIKAIGIYPGCLLSFPRMDDIEFYQRYEEVKKTI